MNVFDTGYVPTTTTTTTTAAATTTTKGSCPSTHPFVYNDGNHCCAVNKEKIYEAQGSLCDGSIIGIDSKCCGGAISACPIKPCKNHVTGWNGQCVIDSNDRLLEHDKQSNSNSRDQCINYCLGAGYLYAGVQAKDWCHCGNNAPPQDKLTHDGDCKTPCPGNNHQTCGGGWRMNVFDTGYVPTTTTTTTTAAATTTTKGSCPSTHPFAYNNGHHCCAVNKEKIYTPQGALCDGSIIGIDSQCCGGAINVCTTPPCNNFEGPKCCKSKTVGHNLYVLIPLPKGYKVDHSCISKCVYSKAHNPGAVYCFKSGHQPVACRDHS